MDRRTFLKSLGAATSAGLAGCVRYRNDLNAEETSGGTVEGVRIFQTENMIEALPRNPDRRPIRVFEDYLTTAIDDLAARSEQFEPVDVTVQREPLSLDLDQIQAREIEFDQYIQDNPEEAATYSNLLIDEQTGQFEPLGLALCEDCGEPVCHLTDDTTDTAIIGGAELTHSVRDFRTSFEAFDPTEGVVRNEELIPLFGGIHEVGHTLCSIHRDGNAWQMQNTPAQYEASDDGVYASTMMGPYVLRYGGEQNTRGRTVAEFDRFETEQSLYYGTLFSETFVERLDELLSIEGDFVNFRRSARQRTTVIGELVNSHTYNGVGFYRPDDTEERVFGTPEYDATLTTVGEKTSFTDLRDGDIIEVYGLTEEDERDDLGPLVQRFEFDG